MPTKRARPSGSPLSWWRTVPFAELDAGSADALARLLRDIELFGYGRWPQAKSGDGAAAVGCAVPLLASGIRGPSFDASMSAVLVCALRGDRAALAVLDTATRRSSARHSARSPKGVAR